MFTVSQLSRTPNHTPTNNEMGVTRKRDVVLTRLTATNLPFLKKFVPNFKNRTYQKKYNKKEVQSQRLKLM